MRSLCVRYARPSYRVGVVSKLPLLNDTRHVPEQNVCSRGGGGKTYTARFKRAADAGNEISPRSRSFALEAACRSLHRIVMQALDANLFAQHTQHGTVKVN